MSKGRDEIFISEIGEECINFSMPAKSYLVQTRAPSSIMSKPRYIREKKNYSINEPPYQAEIFESRPSASIFSLKKDTSMDTNEIKNYSPVANQFSLQIKSSRAYDERQLRNLQEIVDHIDKIAHTKKLA